MIRSPSTKTIAGLKAGAPVPSMSRAAFKMVTCDEAASAIAEAAKIKHRDNKSSDRCKNANIMSSARIDLSGAMAQIFGEPARLSSVYGNIRSDSMREKSRS